MVRPQDLDAAGARGRPRRQDRRRRARGGPQGGRRRGRRRRWSTGSSRRPATTPSGATSRTPSASWSTALDVPTYELPRMPGGVDLGALYELAAAAQAAGHGMITPRAPLAARGIGPLGRRRRLQGARRSTSTRCSTTPAPGSSSAAGPAGSARPRPRRRWRSGRPSAGARSWCSPSTRPAGWRSRWGSRSSTTPRAR